MALEVEGVPLRSASTAEWAASSVILDVGELGVDTTTGETRLGDGSSAWVALKSVSPRRGVTTLVAGSKVVADTQITANSRILVGYQSLGTVTTPKSLGVTARVNGTSFTITSSDGTDTSSVAYAIWQN